MNYLESEVGMENSSNHEDYKDGSRGLSLYNTYQKWKFSFARNELDNAEYTTINVHVRRKTESSLFSIKSYYKTIII